jgi:hypothetical protein
MRGGLTHQPSALGRSYMGSIRGQFADDVDIRFDADPAESKFRAAPGHSRSEQQAIFDKARLDAVQGYACRDRPRTYVDGPQSVELRTNPSEKIATADLK